MWARVHKVDRVRPQAKGGAIVLVEDERTAMAMGRVPPVSTLIALARILNARRLLDARYAGIGEIRYAAAASPPAFLVDAIIRAGASVADGSGERVIMPPSPASITSLIDTAFIDLANHVRTNIGTSTTMVAALRAYEADRRKKPLDREANPAAYWTAVLELAALAGELARTRGGRWIETAETPLPFAIKFPKGELAMPAKLAQRIVEGSETESLEHEPQ